MFHMSIFVIGSFILDQATAQWNKDVTRIYKMLKTTELESTVILYDFKVHVIK